MREPTFRLQLKPKDITTAITPKAEEFLRETAKRLQPIVDRATRRCH
jgi:hypothetical protein